MRSRRLTRPSQFLAASVCLQAAIVTVVMVGGRIVPGSGLMGLVVCYVLAGLIAATLGIAVLRLSRVWVAATLVGPGLALASLGLGFSPLVYGALILLMLGVFAGALGPSRAPLFLTSRRAALCVARLASRAGAAQIADLGAGTGIASFALARALPASCVVAVEASPMLWLMLWMRVFALRLFSGKGRQSMGRMQVVGGDLFKVDLARFDLVYAFLSPAAMEPLVAKARREMRRGTLLVSNSFWSADTPGARMIRLRDPRHTELFVYRF